MMRARRLDGAEGHVRMCWLKRMTRPGFRDDTTGPLVALSLAGGSFVCVPDRSSLQSWLWPES